VCVPGEVRGYWEAHRRFGRLPWRDVVAPAIKVCRNGYHMTRNQFDSLCRNKNIYKDDTLRYTRPFDNGTLFISEGVFGKMNVFQ